MTKFVFLFFVEQVAPTHITVPSGSKLPLSYGKTRVGATGEGDDPTSPRLRVKLQEMFGLNSTPVVGGIFGARSLQVVVELLAPNGRTVATTSDLKSFWEGEYRSVRAELRGRYPKHPWPEDPSFFESTQSTNRQLLSQKQKATSEGEGKRASTRKDKQKVKSPAAKKKKGK